MSPYPATAVGIALILGCLLSIAHPQRLLELISAIPSTPRFWLAVGMRITLGAVLIVSAPACSNPPVVKILGYLMLGAGVGVLLMGATRVDRLVDWVGTFSTAMLRALLLLGLVMGTILLISAGV